MPERYEVLPPVLAVSAGATFVLGSIFAARGYINPDAYTPVSVERRFMPATTSQQLGILALENVPTISEVVPTTITTTTTTHAPITNPPVTSAPNCEQFRSEVQKYSWPVDAAMLVMQKESGCNPNQISKTDDHGLFQLHKIPIYDPAENIRYAYEHKYVTARRGSNNFSAWYAVCDKDTLHSNYANINCQ